MGQTSADVQRDIETFRADLSVSLGELERRARDLAEMPKRASSSPAVRAVAGAGAVSLLAITGYRALASYRERQRPSQKLQRRAERLAGDLGDRWGQARAGLPYTITRRSRERESPDAHPQQPSRLKSLLWMALTAGVVALFGLAARRLSAAVWEVVTHEEPPTRKV